MQMNLPYELECYLLTFLDEKSLCRYELTMKMYAHQYNWWYLFNKLLYRIPFYNNIDWKTYYKNIRILSYDILFYAKDPLNMPVMQIVNMAIDDLPLTFTKWFKFVFDKKAAYNHLSKSPFDFTIANALLQNAIKNGVHQLSTEDIEYYQLLYEHIKYNPALGRLFHIYYEKLIANTRNKILGIRSYINQLMSYFNIA